jgi:hypothetical protein
MRVLRIGLLPKLAICACLAALLAVGTVWARAGSYGLHVLFRHGGTYWLDVTPDSARLSPAMRLALGAAPVAAPGEMAWRAVAAGFEVADLPAMVDGATWMAVFPR